MGSTQKNILLFAATLVFGTAAGCGVGRGSGEHAEKAARDHAKKLGWKVKAVSCAGNDSDGDGYISCTMILKNGQERNVECESGGWTYSRGCKKAPLVKNVNNSVDVHNEY